MIRLLRDVCLISSFWSVFFLGIVSTPFISHLHAGFAVSSEFKSRPIQELDDSLQREFSKPNRRGYYFVFFPCMSRWGYTHSLDALINIKGMRLKSIPEIEKLHAIIYGEVLSKLNSIRCIRPFLANFPLSPDSFTLSIGFVGEQGVFFDPPYFTSLCMNAKTLDFKQYIKDKVPVPFETILKKLICESEDLRKFYNCKVERMSCADKPNVPKVSYILSCCEPYHHSVFEFSKTISAKNNLNFVDLGPIERQFGDFTPFEIAFWGNAQLTIDAARKLAAQFSNEFLKFVQNDKPCLAYMVERSADKYIHDDATFPEVRHIGFRISFWDENIDRQIAPYITEIRMFEGRLKYFTADDGQRLVLVYEESYDDAQSFLKSQKASDGNLGQCNNVDAH